MPLTDRMPGIRDRVFELIGDTVAIGTTDVRGKFFRRYREINFPDGTIQGLDLSFDCNVSDIVLALEEGDEVVFQGSSYKFLRHVPAGGDESGLVTLELKR